MVEISFYIFSVVLSCFDIKERKGPNTIMGTLFLFIIVFGLLEEKLTYISVSMFFVMFIIFCLILIVNKHSIIGGADIKYFLIITLYLQPLAFAYLLIISGVIQSFLIVYFKKIKKRRTAPMIPTIFFSVLLIQILLK